MIHTTKGSPFGCKLIITIWLSFCMSLQFAINLKFRLQIIHIIIQQTTKQHALLSTSKFDSILSSFREFTVLDYIANLSMCCLAFERTIAVYWPLESIRILGRRFTAFLLLLVFLLTIVFAPFMYFVYNIRHVPNYAQVLLLFNQYFMYCNFIYVVYYVSVKYFNIRIITRSRSSEIHFQ